MQDTATLDTGTTAADHRADVTTIAAAQPEQTATGVRQGTSLKSSRRMRRWMQAGRK